MRSADTSAKPSLILTDGGLAAAARADQSHHLPRRHGEAKVLEHRLIFPRWVREKHLVELNVALEGVKRDLSPAANRNLRLQVCILEHSGSRCNSWNVGVKYLHSSAE